MASVRAEDAVIAEFKNPTYLINQAENFWRLASTTTDCKLKSALEAAAREYLQIARKIDPAVPRILDEARY